MRTSKSAGHPFTLKTGTDQFSKRCFVLNIKLWTQTKNRVKVSVMYRLTVKAVPLQAWSGPEGSKKLGFPDFMTTAQDGGKVVSLTHRPPLPPGNTPGTHFY